MRLTMKGRNGVYISTIKSVTTCIKVLRGTEVK